MQKEFDKHLIFYNDSLDCLISLILIELSRDRTTTPNYNVQYILQFIDEYYMTEIKIEQLAKMSNYSLSQFRKIFKEQTGYSPKQYLSKKRLESAKELLAQTNLSAYSIAASCGWEDYNQFQTYFKKCTGCSPLNYRKMHDRDSSLPKTK